MWLLHIGGDVKVLVVPQHLHACSEPRSGLAIAFNVHEGLGPSRVSPRVVLEAAIHHRRFGRSEALVESWRLGSHPRPIRGGIGRGGVRCRPANKPQKAGDQGAADHAGDLQRATIWPSERGDETRDHPTTLQTTECGRYKNSRLDRDSKKKTIDVADRKCIHLFLATNPRGRVLLRSFGAPPEMRCRFATRFAFFIELFRGFLGREFQAFGKRSFEAMGKAIGKRPSLLGMTLDSAKIPWNP